MGAGLLAPDLLEAVDCAFSVDGAKPVGTVITRALGQTSFAFAVHGRAAHAAANPEAGINAIAVAAEIVTALPLGRRAGGGSVNVAAIVGGSIVDRLTPEALAAGRRRVRARTAPSPTPSPIVPSFAARCAATPSQEIEDAIEAITADDRPRLRGARRPL